jgi:hypothetical protein
MFPAASVATAGMPNPLSTAAPNDCASVAFGAAGAARVTAEVPVRELSATDVALIVTVPAAVARAADAYVTAAPDALVAGDTDPHAAPTQFVPDTDHVTPKLCASFVTFAVKLCVTPPVARLTIPGVTVTATLAGGGGVTGAAIKVIAAFADFVASSTDVAVSVTVAGLGIVLGAVYTTAPPDADFAPDKLPHAPPEHPAPESVHDVPSFFGSFATVAVKFAVKLA